jgi:crossover junction endodeoxyribonuclease RusA
MRGGRPITYMPTYAADAKKSYQDLAKIQYSRQGGLTLKNDLEIFVDVFFHDRTRRDLDNYFKVVIDSLTGIVWMDDVQIQKITGQKKFDKENPRIEIIIKVLN